METENAQKFDKGCEHCRNNPNAEKPYVKMKSIPLKDLSESATKKEADRTGQKLDCVLCRNIQGFLAAVQS